MIKKLNSEKVYYETDNIILNKNHLIFKDKIECLGWCITINTHVVNNYFMKKFRIYNTGKIKCHLLKKCN